MTIRILLLGLVMIVLSGCLTVPHDYSKTRLNAVASFACETTDENVTTGLGTAIISFLDLVLYQKEDSEKKFLATYERAKSLFSWEDGKYQFYPAEDFGENQVVYWEQEKIVARKLSEPREEIPAPAGDRTGHLINLETGMVTDVEEIDGVIRQGNQTLCEPYPDRMKSRVVVIGIE